MDPAVIAIGVGGLVTAAIALYRARADKTAVETNTEATLLQAAAATAKGLAEASAMVVEPLRTELRAARDREGTVRERLAVVEKHAKGCDDKLSSLSLEFADLKATVVAANGGTPGPPGPPGAKGETGAKGAQGETGAEGYRG